MRNGWLLCLIGVALFGCQGGKQQEQRARSCLEAAVRLGSTGVGLEDKALLSEALSYLPSHGSPQEKMRVWYCLGCIQLSRGELSEAVVSLEKAESEIAGAADPHGAGLVYRALADAYNWSLNAREDAAYLRKAEKAFEAAGDSLHLAETRLRQAMTHYNRRRWGDAASVLESVRSVALKDSILAPYYYLCLGSLLLDAPSGDAGSALHCFTEALRLGVRFPESKAADYGYALALCGEKERAFRIWDSLETCDSRNRRLLSYRKYCLSKLEGKTVRALAYLEYAASAQDSILREQTSEIISKVRRDYMAAVAGQERLEAERERDGRRSAVATAVLVLVLLLLTGAAVFQEVKARHVRVRQALADSERLVDRLQEAEHHHLVKIHTLNRDVRNARSALKEARLDYLFMLRSAYGRLGDLFEARHFAGSQLETEAVLFRKVGEILKEIDGDRKGVLRLKKFIEEHLDKPLKHLEEDIPDLTEEEILLFCYLVIGYDASLISMLMGIGNLNTVYSKKSRLLGRIRKLPLSKARRYLDLVA